jgi:hypothetical protein
VQVLRRVVYAAAIARQDLQQQVPTGAMSRATASPELPDQS